MFDAPRRLSLCRVLLPEIRKAKPMENGVPSLLLACATSFVGRRQNVAEGTIASLFLCLSPVDDSDDRSHKPTSVSLSGKRSVVSSVLRV